MTVAVLFYIVSLVVFLGCMSIVPIPIIKRLLYPLGHPPPFPRQPALQPAATSEVGAQPLPDGRLGVLGDLLGGGRGVDLDDAALLLVVVDDGHAGLDKGAEALADALLVVVGAAAGLAALEQARLHGGLGAVVEEHELGGADRLLELEGLVQLAREAVDQEPAALGARGLPRDLVLHRVLQQRDRHLHRHDLAVLDVVLDQLPVLGPLPVLLLPQQVARRQVREAVRRDQLGALGALAGAGACSERDCVSDLVRTWALRALP